MLLLISWFSLRAWKAGFNIKMTERFYRLYFTYCLYIAMVRLLTVLLLGINIDTPYLYQIRCLFEVTFQIFIVLPIIRRYIEYTKEMVRIKNELALRSNSELYVWEEPHMVNDDSINTSTSVRYESFPNNNEAHDENIEEIKK